MSAVAALGGAKPRWPALTGWLLAFLAVGFAAFVYWGLGPRPKSRAWWEPESTLSRSLAETSLAPLVEELPVALGGFGVTAAALAIAVFATTRSAVARFLAVFAVLATLCFVFYAIEARYVWRFFHWRWSASIALFAATIAGGLCAPLLAASWLRQRWPLRVALYLPILLAVLVYERNVTGTDPALRFAISPWPLVQVFGVELGAACLATIAVGMGVGLAAGARARRGAGAGFWALGALAAAALPVALLGLAAFQDLLPFAAGPGFFALVGGASLLAFALTASLGIAGDPERTAQRALAWGVGGVLALAPIVLAQVLTRIDYTTTRDGYAQSIIDALGRFREREGAYPDDLAQLVAGGDLAEIPRPAIGFRMLTDQEFVYQNFGESYLLEFSAPRWTQCAYNPPYLDVDVDHDDPPSAEEAEDALDKGEWSCPSKPPELW